jgi:hypothetical protein
VDCFELGLDDLVERPALVDDSLDLVVELQLLHKAVEDGVHTRRRLRI